MKNSLNYFTEKIKGSESEIYTALLIILVGAMSFGLGRLSRLEEGKVPVMIKNEAMVDNSDSIILKDNAPDGRYVASRSGKFYYLPWCSGVKKIKESNKVWFDTESEAVSAGYTPSDNCKGL